MTYAVLPKMELTIHVIFIVYFQVTLSFYDILTFLRFKYWIFRVIFKNYLIINYIPTKILN